MERSVSKEWAGSIAPPRQSEGHERYGQNLSLIIFLLVPTSQSIAVLCLVISAEPLNLANGTSLKSSGHASVRILFRLITVRS